jgi:hypothetical protein
MSLNTTPLSSNSWFLVFLKEMDHFISE